MKKLRSFEDVVALYDEDAKREKGIKIVRVVTACLDHDVERAIFIVTDLLGRELGKFQTEEEARVAYGLTPIEELKREYDKILSQRPFSQKLISMIDSILIAIFIGIAIGIYFYCIFF